LTDNYVQILNRAMRRGAALPGTVPRDVAYAPAAAA